MKCPARLTRSKTYSRVAKRDEELARARATAQYAGDADPYKHDDEPMMTISTMMTMSRSRIGTMTTPSGLLVIDKPQGVTSHDVVAAVRGALHIKKVGHAGTLDPMATGMLVVAFGHATRLLNAIVEHDKPTRPPYASACAPSDSARRTTTDDADGELLPGEGTIAEFLTTDR